MVWALRFEGFTLDRSGPVLSLKRGATDIPLRPQAIKVLAYLADRPGQAISNNELIENCWKEGKRKDTRVNSVAQCIKEIRDALGETKKPIIRTLPRQGYVFVAPLSKAAPALADDPPGVHLPAEQEAAAPPPVSKWPSRTTALLGTAPRLPAVLTLTIAAAVCLVWILWPTRPAELTMTAAPSLVVLPIKPLGDESDTALATLADEIVAAIWRAPRGFDPLIQPSSAVKDPLGDPRAIGRSLGVRYLARILARRESEKVHISVQLIEASNARHIWGRDFAYRPGEPKAQSRLAARIAQTLVAEILRAEVRRPLPARLEAGHFVMLGHKLMTDEGDEKANAEAITYFEKALAADPEHFRALVQYARAIARHRIIGWMPESEAGERVAKAEEAIELAIKIDPYAAGAHLTHGNVLRAKSEYDRAIGAFERALELDENFVHARAELARTLIDVGRAEEAITLLKEAIEATPIGISPYFWYFWLGLAALHLPDRNADALTWFAKSYDYNNKYDYTLRLWAVALADAGKVEEAREKVQELLKLRKNATVDDGSGAHLRLPPEVAKVRKHFRETLKRLGLPEDKMSAASAR